MEKRCKMTIISGLYVSLKRSVMCFSMSKHTERMEFDGKHLFNSNAGVYSQGNSYLNDNVNKSMWIQCTWHRKHLKLWWLYFFVLRVIIRTFIFLSILECSLFFSPSKNFLWKERLYSCQVLLSIIFSQHSVFKPWLEKITSPVLWMVI